MRRKIWQFLVVILVGLTSTTLALAQCSDDPSPTLTSGGEWLVRGLKEGREIDGILANVQLNEVIPCPIEIQRVQTRLDGRRWLIPDEQAVIRLVENGHAIWRPTLDIPLSDETITRLNDLSTNQEQLDALQADRLLDEHRDQYVHVRGTVIDVERREGRYFINFGDNYRTDFTAGVQGMGLEHLIDIHGRVTSLKDNELIVRGQIERFNGPFITISNGWQITVLSNGEQQ